MEKELEGELKIKNGSGMQTVHFDFLILKCSFLNFAVQASASIIRCYRPKIKKFSYWWTKWTKLPLIRLTICKIMNFIFLFLAYFESFRGHLGKMKGQNASKPCYYEVIIITGFIQTLLYKVRMLFILAILDRMLKFFFFF